MEPVNWLELLVMSSSCGLGEWWMSGALPVGGRVTRREGVPPPDIDDVGDGPVGVGSLR
jgi:hypothetical protein